MEDAVLAGILADTPPGERMEVVTRALQVGARGLVSMGLDVGLAEVDERVRRSMEQATRHASEQVTQILEEARAAMRESLDPDHRSSVVARTIADFTTWRDAFLSSLDPDAGGSHTHRLLDRLHHLLGPGGALEDRLHTALDPAADGSGLARVVELIDRRFVELREALAEQRGRQQEAERGTAKGVRFEDAVEERLREVARPLGAVVSRTGLEAGGLGADSRVGDFVIDLPEDRGRLVVEAKNVATIGLTGKNGMLEELDRAMANRHAHVGICVSAKDAFPTEVGDFGVYGDRILVVDDGEGTMLAIAVRWAIARLSSLRAESGGVDVPAMEETLERIRRLAQRFSANKRTLTDIAGSVEKVRDSLVDMRRELLDAVDDAAAELRRGGDADIVEIRQAG